MKTFLEKVFDAGQNYKADQLKRMGNFYPDFQNFWDTISHEELMDYISNYLTAHNKEIIDESRLEYLENVLQNHPG